MLWIRWGSALAFLGVAAGAFGAHALRQSLTPNAMAAYQTAVLYQFIHALGLLAVGCLALHQQGGHPALRAAGIAFLLGTALFSGSLYLLSLTGVRAWGAVTPIGGVLFLMGWVSLAVAAR